MPSAAPLLDAPRGRRAGRRSTRPRPVGASAVARHLKRRAAVDATVEADHRTPARLLRRRRPSRRSPSTEQRRARGEELARLARVLDDERPRRDRATSRPARRGRAQDRCSRASSRSSSVACSAVAVGASSGQPLDARSPGSYDVRRSSTSGAEQRPVRTRLVLVRHADAPRVDESSFRRSHGRTARACARTRRRRRRRHRVPLPALVRADAREDLLVAPGVAWQNRTVPSPSTSTDSVSGSAPRNSISPSESRGPDELHHLRRREPLPCRLDDLAVGVPADEARVAVECAQALERLGRRRSQRDVATDEDQVVRVDLGEHRVERGRFP